MFQVILRPIAGGFFWCIPVHVRFKGLPAFKSLITKFQAHETNMLLHNIQDNKNIFINIEFHTTFKKQVMIVCNACGQVFTSFENEYPGIGCADLRFHGTLKNQKIYQWP